VVLRHPVGERLGKRGDLGQVLVAGGDHHGAATQVTAAGPQNVPIAGGCQPGNPYAGADGSVGGELLEPLDDVHPGRIGIRRLLAE
jgi:hypothetical protein